MKAGPKAELEALATAREETGAIPPRPGASPADRPHVPPPCDLLTFRPCHPTPEMKVTREEMKAARLPMECAQHPAGHPCVTHCSAPTRPWPPARPGHMCRTLPRSPAKGAQLRRGR